MLDSDSDNDTERFFDMHPMNLKTVESRTSQAKMLTGQSFSDMDSDEDTANQFNFTMETFDDNQQQTSVDKSEEQKQKSDYDNKS